MRTRPPCSEAIPAVIHASSSCSTLPREALGAAVEDPRRVGGDVKVQLGPVEERAQRGFVEGRESTRTPSGRVGASRHASAIARPACAARSSASRLRASRRSASSASATVPRSASATCARSASRTRSAPPPPAAAAARRCRRGHRWARGAPSPAHRPRAPRAGCAAGGCATLPRGPPRRRRPRPRAGVRGTWRGRRRRRGGASRGPAPVEVVHPPQHLAGAARALRGFAAQQVQHERLHRGGDLLAVAGAAAGGWRTAARRSARARPRRRRDARRRGPRRASPRGRRGRWRA